MVVISSVPAKLSGVTQDRMAAPFKSTVQAPQAASRNAAAEFRAG